MKAGGGVPFHLKLFLKVGRLYLAQRDWARAAQYLEYYIQLTDADWETYFALGVANMNLRAGRKSDLRALMAYDHAIAIIPPDASAALRARLYSYRGAAKKRLGRLEEAALEAMPQSRNRLLVKGYELVDATYNLASIEAMMGHRDAALTQLRELNQLGGLPLILGHRDDYFSSLKGDPEFQELPLRRVFSYIKADNGILLLLGVVHVSGARCYRLITPAAYSIRQIR